MRPLYIFDLDGTLALIDHRRALLDNKDDPDRWTKFYAACVRDEANSPVVEIFTHLQSTGADCWIWSGRSSEVQAQTVDWLECKVSEKLSLTMRAEGDFTPDEVLKRQWLDAMSPADRARLVAVFDDRDKVVAMWRAAGVACFQVAPGEF